MAPAGIRLATDEDGRMTLDRSPHARPPHGPDVALVLGGGHALGAYHGGACEAMRAGGLWPDRIVGSSTGAITAAILAGNPPERRVERLRRYWDEAAQAGPWPATVPPSRTGPLRELYNAAHVALALGLGRPSIFRPRYAEAWRPGEVALHDHAPLRGTLARLVDFDLLNRAGPRLSLGCVDVESGEEVWFDSAEERIRPEHVLASAALMPHLPPVAIGGRLLCDPGYVNNLPVDRALAEPPARDLLCLVVDLFCLRGGRPASLGAAVGRMEDVLFASHAGRHVAALRREYELRARLEPGGPSVRVVHLAYRAPGHEVAARMFDFSPASIDDRWAAGRRDMARALGLAASGAGSPGCFAYLAVDAGNDPGRGEGTGPARGP
jgi:NTE family protein